MDGVSSLFEKWPGFHIEHSGIGIVLFGLDGMIVQMNRRACENVGIDPNNVKGRAASEVLGDEWGKAIQKRIDTVAATGESITFEDETLFPAGSRWYRSVYTPVPDNKGHYLGVQVVSDDITDLKLATQGLKESDEKYSSLFENMLHAFALHKIVLDDDGNPVDYIFLETNRAFEKFTGLKRVNIIGKRATEILPGVEKDPADWIGQYGNVALTGKTIQTELFSQPLDLWFSVRAFSHKRGEFATVFEDITYRKRAEEKLRESEAKLRSMLDATTEIAGLLTSDGTILSSNDALAKSLGRKKEEIIGKSFLGFLSGEIRESRKARLQKIVESKSAAHWEDGRAERSFANSVFPILDDDGNVQHLALFARDITRQKKSEELIQYKLEIEKLVADISTSFAYTGSEEIDIVLQSALEKVVRFAGLDRGSIFLISDDQSTVTNTHEWCANPDDSQTALFQNIPISTFSWYRNEMLRKNVIMISSIDDYPPEAKKEMEWVKEHGFRSMLFAPLFKQDDIQGAMGLYGEIGKEISWSQEFTDALKTIGSITINLLERKHAEMELKRSEERRSAWIENSPVCTKVLDRDFNLQFMSASGVNDLNIDDISEYYGKPYPFDFYPDSFKQSMIPNLIKAREAGEIVTQEASVNDTDGNVLWYESTIVPIYDAENKLDYILVVSLETTARKNAEMETRVFRSISDKAVHGNAIADLHGNLTYINEYFAQIHGYAAEDILGKNLSLFYSAEQLEAVHRINERLVIDGSYPPTEVWHSHKDGTEFPMLMTGVMIRDEQGNPQSLAASAIDLTEHKRSKAAAREIEERFQTVVEQSPVAIEIYGLDGRLTTVNDAWAEFWGLEKESVGDFNIFDDPECERTGLTAAFRKAQQGELSVLSELQYDPEKSGFSDGRTRWISAKMYPIKDLGGTVVNIVLTYDDITDRVETLEALKESESLLKIAQQIARIGNFTWNIQTGEALWSEEMYRLLKYDRDAVIDFTRINNEIHHPDDLERITRWLTDTIESGIEEPVQNEHRLICKDGEVVHVQVNGRIEYEDGKALKMIGTCLNITDRKRIEDALEKRLMALTRPPGDSEGITFEDLFNPDDIQRLQDEFALATGVASIITNPDGTPITRPSNFCRLCRDIIRTSEKGCENCFKSDAALGRPNPDGPIVQLCMSGGLWDAGASITVGDRHIANWLIGQVRDETQSEETIRNYAREIGVDESAAVEAFQEVTPMKRGQFEMIAHALFTLANQLSRSAFQNIQQARFITDRNKAEEKQKLERRCMMDILDAIPDGIYIVSQQYDIEYTNPAIDKAFGPIHGRKCYEYFHDRTGACPWCKNPEIFAGKSVEWEWHSDKTGRDYMLFDTPFKNTDGSISKLEIFYDITDRKQSDNLLRDAMKLSEDYINSLPGLFYVFDEKRMVRWNKEWEVVSGYSKDEIANMYGTDFFEGPDKILVEERMREVFLTGTSHVEAEVVTKEGDRIPYYFSGVRKEFNGKPHLVGLGIDITDRKKSEMEIKNMLTEIRNLKDQLEAENVYLLKEIRMAHLHGNIVDESERMRSVLAQAEQVATTDSTVLILGETGTGKELLARAIHRMSPRKKRPMIVVNCAAIPDTLVESELFGREKGAYTGALTKLVGRFEVADGSTIFLDEIGDLPFEVQAKLLRVLQEGEFERLGSKDTVKVDVRIIAATNHDLEREAAQKTFREDLFYRLNVFPITVPPLRERTEDIEPLVWSFISEFCEKMGKRVESVSQSDMKSVLNYAWPGNVRELRNTIERAMIRATGKQLQISITPQTPTQPENLTLAERERQQITETLGRTNWRIRGKGGAAELLDLKPTTLEARMKKMDIRRPE